VMLDVKYRAPGGGWGVFTGSKLSRGVMFRGQTVGGKKKKWMFTDYPRRQSKMRLKKGNAKARAVENATRGKKREPREAASNKPQFGGQGKN